MTFSKRIKEEALVKSRRCCCVCNEFAGLYTNIHHIIPEAKGGSNDIENSIVLCIRCHGEAGHYNKEHPIGNKYSQSELRKHRDKWWEWCGNNPGKPLPNQPIIIEPSKIDLCKGEWDVHTPFKIYNKSDEIFYQIVVKIALESKEITSEDILIKFQGVKNEISLDIGIITVVGDILRINGLDDSDNEVIFLILNSMDPRSVSTFMLINNSDFDETIKRSNCYLSICDYTKTPISIKYKRGKKAAIPFTLPETIRMKGVAIRLNRK